MKRSILCILAVTLAMFASASPVMPSEAIRVAQAWAQKNSAFGVRSVASDRAVPFTNEVTTLWYQVQMSDGSCLVVSPVTELEPVIAVLEKVNAEEGLPEGHPLLAMLTADMKDRLSKLGLYRPAQVRGGHVRLGAAPADEEAVPSDPVLAEWAERGKAKWARLLSGGRPRLKAAPEQGVVDIEVQMGIVDGFEEGGRFTHWNQDAAGGGYCYNYHTPSHAVCGCVATSMGAMMQFFSVTGCVKGATCPSGLIRETQDHIVGATYNGGGAGTYRTIGGTYDWSILDGKTNREGYDSLTDAQRELLGRVAYDCGVAVAMAWTSTSSGSGAYVMDVAAALRDVFGFKDARAVINPTAEQYVKLIYYQCRAGAPVQLGITGSGGGHSVLAVGYGEDDDGVPRVRVFTGWGGAGDAWYSLPYITTASVPGGSSYNFNVVQQIVTMIGYDTDETVPVVGHMDAPGKEIEVEGTGRTIFSNEQGYFGTRVSPGVTVTLRCDGKSAEVVVSPEAAVKAGEYWVDDVDALCGAIPEEIEFILLNSSVAYSFAQAKAIALAEGKAILRVSGKTGDEATTALLDRIYAMDKVNEGGFTNRYVYFFSSAKSTNPDLPDGNPSFGVFLPSDAEQSGRWQYTNGRLSYGYGYSSELQQTVTNDYDVAEEEMFYTITNESYVATWGLYGTEFYSMTNFPYTTNDLVESVVPLVLDNGWAEFCRRTHGIRLTVESDAEETGLPSPTFGVHENTYTNGQEITAIAPDGLVTNDAQNVIFGFDAWTLTVTNTVSGGRARVKNGTGSEAVFTLSSNDVAALVWKLEPKSVWIEIEDIEDWGMRLGVTSPGTGWYQYGKTVTFTATPEDGFHFKEWTTASHASGAALPEYLESFRNRASISFRVTEPLSLYAYYDEGDPAPPEVSSSDQTLTVLSLDYSGYPFTDANMPEVEVVIYPAASTNELAMEDEIVLPSNTYAVASIAADTFTDVFGSEWRCDMWALWPTNATMEPIAYGYGTRTCEFALDDGAELCWYWTPVADDSGGTEPVDPDPPEGPEGGVLLTIYPNADGTMTVKAKIANAKEGAWYVLKSATSLTDEFVPLEDASANKKAYKNDEPPGTLVLESTFVPADQKRFYKVSAEKEEP